MQLFRVQEITGHVLPLLGLGVRFIRRYEGTHRFRSGVPSLRVCL